MAPVPVHRIEPSSWDRDVRRAATWLKARGVRTGDRIGVVPINHPGTLAVLHGALRTGVIPVMLREEMSAADRDWIVADADLGVMVERPDLYPWTDAPEDADVAPVPLGRPMFYTSGTTGRPKGVWTGVLPEDMAVDLAADERDLWWPEPGAPFLVCSPLHHTAGFRAATSALLAGSPVVLLERFDPDQVVRELAEGGVTGTFMVPTHLRRIFAPGRGDPPPVPSVRRILHAGEPCPDELKRRAMAWLPPDALWEFYGASEGQFTAISPDDWLEHPGSVGRARQGRRLEVAQPDGEGVGTVFATAPPFGRWEYWRDPERTAAAWRGDAFTAGDLGRLDAGGYLYLTSRREDLIITGGVNVYPAEVERVLLEHPAVSDVVVFGVADPQWGQRVCAAAVADGATSSQLMAWARERLDPARRPKELRLVDSLPRTSTGKVDRGTLRRGSGQPG